MDLNNINNEWEREAPKLASIENRNPFSIPAGYFDSLQEHLNSRLFLLELHPDKAASDFTVPQGYFDTLADQIEGRIVVEKLKEEIIGNNFTVPEGYFSTLQNRISERVEEPVKVISLQRRVISSWISYAAAACITIAVSAGIYFNVQNNKFNVPANAAISDLSNVSDEAIFDYLDVRGTRIDMPVIIENMRADNESPSIDDIPTEALEDYVDNNLL